MRKARIFVGDVPAGILEEQSPGSSYAFRYDDGYDGQAVSLTMPANVREYLFQSFPPFFDGLLPEGFQLDALVRQKKIDRSDFFSLLIAVGDDLVGCITAKEIA
ncbi:MAG: HipA N-terminal domain-containing protein [Ignavibacteriales bacterium]|nr:HipA N-terminal domain-containing protein [Ignavibacteriales bacterium]